MKWGVRACVLLVLLALAAVIPACGGGGDDDDDDKASYGEDIEGLYPAVMTIAADDCTPENEGTSENWIITIDQSKDLRVAWVSYQEPGTGLDPVELFKADVYGTVVVKAGIESTSAGNDCTKFNVQNYRVKVDLETLEISGDLSSDIFYQGAGCDSSARDCHFEQVIEPGSLGD